MHKLLRLVFFHLLWHILQALKMDTLYLTIRIYCRLCPSPTVPNMSPNEQESTIRVGWSDHSWSFMVIRAMTMTMTIHLNSIILVRVASMKFLNMFKMFVWLARISFIRGDTHGERVVIVFVAQLTCCIPVDSHCTIGHSCKYISHERSANVTQ